MSNEVEFITIIRPSFMRFCKDACRAAAFNHILFRIAGKCKDQPKEKIQSGDITWYASNELITEEMSHAWGVCKVRKEINELLTMGLFDRRNNPQWGADRTKHFAFGTEQCQKFLDYCEECSICVVHLGLSPEVTHLIYSSNANDKSIKCICSIHQMETMDISNANDKSIEAITIDSIQRLPTIDSIKEDESHAQNASAFAPPTPAPEKQENAAPTKTVRKPRKPKVVLTAEQQAEASELETRIVAVFETFDLIARECYRDPDFSYDRSKVAREAIIQFLAISPRPTVEKLKTHYRDLFKRPPSKDGFVWRDNMSIAAVCRDYGRKPTLVATAPGATSTLASDPEFIARNERNKARAREEAAVIRAKRAAEQAQKEVQQYAVSR